LLLFHKTKEESSFFEKKEAKKLLFLVLRGRLCASGAASGRVAA
jgi:hypothetical protein